MAAKFINKFDIGCDPEFVVISPQGRVFNLLGTLPEKGPVGWDHNGKVAEMRPEKCRGTYTMVKRLAALLKNPHLTKCQSYRWRAGAWFEDPDKQHVVLGGHVHFDLTVEQAPKDMLAALDHTTLLLEHLDLLPKHESQLRRTKTQYGRWGEVRTNDGHIEYRTMASWLYSPMAAFTCLTLAKLAVASPETALARLKRGTSKIAITKFLEDFKGKDLNADRLLHYVEKGALVKMDPEGDMKQAWEEKL